MAKSEIKIEDFNKSECDKIYYNWESNKKKLGDLRLENHFFDALEPLMKCWLSFKPQKINLWIINLN